MVAPVSGAVFQVDLKGLQPVLRKMHRLPIDLQKKGLRSAMAMGASVVKKQAVQNVRKYDDPSTKERVWRNVVVQFASRSSKRIGGIMMRVGVRGGARQYGNTRENVRKGRVGKSYKIGGDKGNPGGDTWYWRFLEFGVPSRGISAKRPLTSALEQMSERATEVIATKLSDEITKYVAKQG